jgi:TP901 family phage tail tape measure protein
MADEFVIRIVNDAVNQALAQMKQVDSKSKETTDAWKKELKQKEAAEAEYYKRLNLQYKQHVSSLSKDDKNYFREKQNLQLQQLSLSRNLSDSQKSILANQIRDQIAMEKAKHAESISLAYKLQNTLESVFQRAVFYTAVYNGISQVTGGIKEWIKSNVELDYALAKVNTISDVTVGQMAKILDISQLTGRSAVDLTNALYEINSANIKGADAMRVMEVSTRAAVAGFTSAEDAADTLTDVLNAYGFSTSQTEAVSDKLLKAVEIGKLKWEEYHGVLGRILPSSYQLGISLDELLGSLSTLTLSGLKFNEATTGMRNIFMKMLKPTKDMDIALAGLNKDLGTSYTSIQQVLKVKGIIGTLQLLGKSMKETDLESSDLFNTVRGLTAQLSLMSDAGAKATEITEQIKGATGTTNEQMGVMSDTIVESKNRMIAAWQALGVEVFSFGDGMKNLYAFLGGTANLLKTISPLIVGFTAAVGAAGLAIATWGVRLITTNYIIPLVSAGIQFLSNMFKKQAVEAGLAGFAVMRFGDAAVVAGAKAGVGAVGVTTFVGALSGITLILGAAAAIWAGYNAWVSKNAADTAILKERTESMTKAFDEARKSTNLLNRVRPFEGWDITELTKQIDANNEKLKKRQDVLDKITTLESRIATHQERGWDVSEYNEQLIQAKNELSDIGEITESELEMYESMNKELDYKKKKLTNIQALIKEIVDGTRDVKEAEFETLDIGSLEEIRSKFEKELDDIFFKRKTDPLFALMDVSDAEYNMTEALDKINNVIAKFTAEGQRKIKEENEKTLSKQNSFWQKYHEAFLNQTHEGRLALIEEQRKAAEDEAESMGQTEEKKKELKAYYNNLILKENEDYSNELSKRTKDLYDIEKKWIDATLKLKLDRAKEESNNVKSNEEKLEALRESYFFTEIQKINAKYDLELEKVKELSVLKAVTWQEELALIDAIEKKRQESIIAHEKSITDAKIAEWQKQYAGFKSMIDDSMGAVVDFGTLQMGALIDSAEVTSKSLQGIWENWKNSMLRAINEIIARELIAAALRLIISGMSFGTMTKVLTFVMDVVKPPVKDAIIQDGTITPFRKDDVVAIGTNMYGTRSGYGTSGIEAKIAETNKMLSVLNYNLVKKNMVVNVDPITPEKINDLNRQGEKKNRMIGYATT